MPRRFKLMQRACAAAVLGATTFAAQATVFGGVDFPGGLSSFADAVVSYNPVIIGGEPAAPDRNPNNALGAPQGSITCVNPATCHSVSLGQGGSLTLEFTDNRLTGSGTSALDLWIFEVGADVEDTYVAISRDGITFYEVGKVLGATAGIDIDAFGFGPADEFRFVRLIDDPKEGGANGRDNSGADIDAIGAISSRRVETVPVPQSPWLVAAALALAGFVSRRRGKAV